MIDLDTIEARANAATRGPWRAFYDDYERGTWLVSQVDSEGLIHDDGIIVASGVPAADADFVAAAREDIPALVAEVRRLRDAIIEAADFGLGRYGCPFCGSARAEHFRDCIMVQVAPERGILPDPRPTPDSPSMLRR